ncbi:hypothetical protein MPH_13940, partial [Macrophomina phaseolina MS6]
MTKYDLTKRLTPSRSSFHHPFNAIGNLEGTLLSMSVSKALLVVRAISSISQQSLPQLDLRSGLLLITDTFSTFFGTSRGMAKTKGHKDF